MFVKLGTVSVFAEHTIHDVGQYHAAGECVDFVV